MRHFVMTVFVAACLCAWANPAEANEKPKRQSKSSRRTVTVQPAPVVVRTPVTTRPSVRIQGNPISDKLSPAIERTSNRFPNALLYKPNDKTTTQEQRQFATLLVQEAPTPGNPVPDHLRFGAVVTDGLGQTMVDTQRPTVYTTESHVLLGEVYCTQRVHVWAYPGPSGKGPVWRGVRTTYAPDKYPLIWELLTAEGEPAILFVCSTIDNAAQKEFGKASPGRQSSAEYALDKQPDVVVARVLPPGAEPMGPMVYLDAAGKTVNTLLCRCMEAQAGHFIENPYYDILPLEILGDVQVAAEGPFRLVHSAVPQFGGIGKVWVEQVLRMPKRF